VTRAARSPVPVQESSPPWIAPALAFAVAIVAFALYFSTLLPGLDFGDTAAFQDAGGALDVTPRQGYPLYFALGNLVVSAVGGEPAYGMNLASAIAAALACGVLTWLAARMLRSTLGGVFTGLLFAGSYTFWSQAIIAEVYALHLLMLSLSLLTLLWWGERPSSFTRLALFFAVYALGYGNHLMMVLLLVPATMFLAVSMPRGLRDLVAPRVLALAIGLAALGSLQYLWNLRFLYSLPSSPPSLIDALQTFWFDVTKSDWRATMVAGIDRSAYPRRVGMYRFDLLQQFGWTGAALALVGLLWFWVRSWRTWLLLVSGWLIAAAFAYSYNVGDTHVFFLPSHLFVALFAGAGVTAVTGLLDRQTKIWPPAGRALVVLAVLAYPAWRIWDTWPAVDRSGDDRPQQLVKQFTAGLHSESSIYFADLNWQLQNGLDYYTHHLRPDVLAMDPSDRTLTLPWLFASNLSRGRDMVLSPQARRLVETAYGPLYTIDPDPEASPAPLAGRLSTLPGGTVYVLALLRAYNDIPLNTAELADAVSGLTAGTATLPTDRLYTIMAGRTGEPPVMIRSESQPFRVRMTIGTLPLEIRMESWLPVDTMRRAGFGHVIVEHHHVFTLERGVSVVALGPDRRPLVATYASGLFEPPTRFRIRARPSA
jgi:hypothetical protein